VVTLAQFRKLALAMPGAVAGEHMQHPDFRANGRIFATLHPDGKRGMVKLTPGQQRQRLAELATALAPASGAWGRQGCTMVELALIDRDALGELLIDAWQNANAASKKRASKK